MLIDEVVEVVKLFAFDWSLTIRSRRSDENVLSFDNKMKSRYFN